MWVFYWVTDMGVSTEVSLAFNYNPLFGSWGSASDKAEHHLGETPLQDLLMNLGLQLLCAPYCTTCGCRCAQWKESSAYSTTKTQISLGNVVRGIFVLLSLSILPRDLRFNCASLKPQQTCCLVGVNWCVSSYSSPFLK